MPPASTDPNLIIESETWEGLKLTVDRDNGVIPGVKILGRISKNGREYTESCIAKAAKLYEGARVNVDHGEPGKPRSYKDRIGHFEAVEARSDGLYGNLHFNPKHVCAEQLAWDAEHAPKNGGFSHVVVGGKTSTKNGKTVVESIAAVKSVDLVADPATNAGFYEGEISDKMEGDEASRALRKVCDTAQSLMSDVLWGYSSPGGGNKSYPDFKSKKKRILQILADWTKEVSSASAASDKAGDTGESLINKKGVHMELTEATLADIKTSRPDLLSQLAEEQKQSDEAKAAAAKLASLEEENKALKANEAARLLKEQIAAELTEAKLDAAKIPASIMEAIQTQPDQAKRKVLIADCAKLATATVVAPQTTPAFVPFTAPRTGAPVPITEGVAAGFGGKKTWTE